MRVMVAARTRGLGEQMTERRQQLGLSQARAARTAGVSRTTWISWEKGGSTPEDYNYVKIERALDWERGSVREAISTGRPAVELGEEQPQQRPSWWFRPPRPGEEPDLWDETEREMWRIVEVDELVRASYINDRRRRLHGRRGVDANGPRESA